jgi:hypothetical protein
MVWKLWSRDEMKCVLEWGDAFNLKAEGPSLTVLIDWLQLAASSTNHCCQISHAKAKKMTLPSYLECPNPSEPVDNLKAEGPSLSLYSLDTRNVLDKEKTFRINSSN